MSEYKPKYKISFTKESRLNKKPDYMGDFTYDLIQQLYIRCDERDKEIERLNNIINEFEDFITNVDSHINLGDESEEFILVRDKWLELQELKGSGRE